MNILSIQSWVSYGHVGNAAAMFPLQRLGAEVWAIHTVQFSNHTGYGSWTGQSFTGDAVGDLLRGLAARGVLGGLDAVLSGYLGDAAIGSAILEAVGQARAANSALLYCCDPVIGDVARGRFVRAPVAEFLSEHAVGQADILTPNQFELEQLTGRSCADRTGLRLAVRELQARMRAAGPRLVLVTSVRNRDSPPDRAEMLAASPGESFLLRTPQIAMAANGAGDLIAALFLFHVRAGAGVRAALERAGSATWGVLDHTHRQGAAELCLVAAQQELVAPVRCFAAEPLEP